MQHLPSDDKVWKAFDRRARVSKQGALQWSRAKVDQGSEIFLSQAGMTWNLQDLAVNCSIPWQQGTEVDGGEAG